MQNPLDAYSTTPVQNTQSNPSNVMTGVATGVATVGLLAAGAYVGYYLYHLFTDPYPLSKDDMKRYYAMVNAYKKMGTDIPDKWKLKEKNTTNYHMNYQEVIYSLNSSIEHLLQENSPLHLARASIFILIKRHLEYVVERWKSIDTVTDSFDRPDGIEAMFLYEMVMWFQLEAPGMQVLNKNSAITFQKRAAYCKEVLANLTKNRWHNEKRSNFKDLVERLSIEIDEYQAYIVYRYETATFNELVNQLSDSLLGLSAQSFYTMYLLINGIEQSNLVVKQFLNPNESDPKISAVRETKLGQWLYQTFFLAGITNSLFESSKLFTMDDIQNHLTDDLPKTKEQCLSDPKLKIKTSSKQWGHWAFATTEPVPVPVPVAAEDHQHESTDVETNSALQNPSIKPQTPAPSYRSPSLKLRFRAKPKEMDLLRNPVIYAWQIRHLLQLTLQFYFIRRNLLRSSTIASAIGEEWIYGHDVGKVVLDELLTSVYDVVAEYQTTFLTFWTSYFDEHYKPYAKKEHVDDPMHNCHNRLHAIDQQNKRLILGTINGIEELIMKIREQAIRHPEKMKKIKQTKIELLSDMLIFLKSRNKENTKNYNKIQDALNELKNAKLEEPIKTEANKLASQAMVDEIVVSRINDEINSQVSIYLREKARIEATVISKILKEKAPNSHTIPLASLEQVYIQEARNIMDSNKLPDINMASSQAEIQVDVLAALDGIYSKKSKLSFRQGADLEQSREDLSQVDRCMHLNTTMTEHDITTKQEIGALKKMAQQNNRHQNYLFQPGTISLAQTSNTEGIYVPK